MKVERLENQNETFIEKHKSTSGNVASNQKNLVVIVGLGGNEAEPRHGSKRLGGFK